MKRCVDAFVINVLKSKEILAFLRVSIPLLSDIGWEGILHDGWMKATPGYLFIENNYFNLESLFDRSSYHISTHPLFPFHSAELRAFSLEYASS